MIPRANTLSVIISASRQRHFLHGTLLAVRLAAERAEREGVAIDISVLAYDCDPETAFWLEERAMYPVHRSMHGSLGSARNEAIARATGEYIAFIDGGDLCSVNFFSTALGQDRKSDGRVVWRPAISIGFAGSYFNIDEYSVRETPDSRHLDHATILVENPYASCFLVSRHLFDQVPFPEEDIDRGWTDIDWWWCANLAGAKIHQVPASNTLHYFRTALRTRPATHRLPFGPTSLER